MQSLIRQHRELWKNTAFVFSTSLGLVFLLISVFLNYRAGTYAFHSMSNGVSDLILDYLPVKDVHIIFIDGAIAMALFTFGLSLYYIRYMPFILKNIGLLYFFRSVAITLTHLGPPLAMNDIYLASSITERFIYGADYFFSGHTALPFIIALIFWEKKWLRYFYLIITGTFGFTALLGHVHYSIDVFAAPFIAYSTYALAKYVFRRDYDFLEIKEQSEKSKV